MLSQASTTGTDDWWLMQCATEMGLTFPRLAKLRRYRSGDAPVPEEASMAMREAYKKWAKTGRLVMSDLIVNARTNRQKVIGFRTSAVGDEDGNAAAWATWKRSHMTVNVRGFLDDYGHYGKSFLTTTGSPVEGSLGDFSLPLLVPTNGWTTYTIPHPAMPWLAIAGIVLKHDPVLGMDIITLFRPGYMRSAIKPAKTTTFPTDGSLWNPGNAWTWIGAAQPLGYTADVPIVALEAPDGFGFYEKHLDSLDRINETIKQRSTIIAMQAFRQRAVKGDLPQHYPEDHPQAGEMIDYDNIFKAGPAALWMLPDGAEIWESAVTDISPILAACKEDIKYLAAVTSTPLYVLSPDAAAGSAEGAALSKEMVSFSVEDMNERTDAVLATNLGLAFAAQRDVARSDPAGIETIFASIDRVSILQRAAAAPSAKAGGMPQRLIDEMIFGLTPAQIAQAKQDRANEAFDTPVVVPNTAQFAPAAPIAAATPVADPLAVPAVP